MTVIYNYLVNTYEDPAESIRKFIFDKWTAANTDNVTPKMYSPLGFDGNISSIDTKDEHNRADYNKPRTSDFIRFYELRTVRIQPDIMVNNVTRELVMISIDLYSINSYRSTLFQQELSNIIFENQPNTSTRIPKTNGEDSAIATFNTQSFEWARIGLITDAGITKGHNALLGCAIEKFKTWLGIRNTL